MASWRRRKLAAQGYLSARGAANPRGGRRRRRNPDLSLAGIMGAFRATIGSQSMLALAGQATLGMSVATFVPAAIESLSGGRLRNSGYQGLGMTAVSAAVAYMLGGLAENTIARFTGGVAPKAIRGLGFGLAVGGLTATAIRGLYELAPKTFEWLKLPQLRQPTVQLRIPTGAGAKAAAGMGRMGDWMELQGMRGMRGGLRGLSGVTDPETLVAGESFARTVSQFEGMGGVGDWMELKGLGDYRVPMSAIRAPGQQLGGMYPGQYGGPVGMRAAGAPLDGFRGMGRGMGDWIEMLPDSSLAQQQFQPALEAF